MLAPICLFTYNRLDETKQTIEALQKNYLAQESELFIFSDGHKNDLGYQKVNKVRKYIKTVTGFKKITILESNVNKGLANSIINGVTKIINEYGKVIVLEDDLITSRNFLDFMNQALDFFSLEKKSFSISGYTMNLPILENYPKDYYLAYRASSWGWGTWKDRWDEVDWEVIGYKNFRRNIFQQIKFMRGGSDMLRMLHNQMKGKIDSWAIRWCYDQFLKDTLTVFPSISKVKNIGFNKNATHTKKTQRFNTFLDNGEKSSFRFHTEIEIDMSVLKSFKNKFSVKERLLEKIKNL